jgi:hypothetical protein
MLEATCNLLRSIFEIDKLAGTVNILVASSSEGYFRHSPELELIRTSSDEFDIV